MKLYDLTWADINCIFGSKSKQLLPKVFKAFQVHYTTKVHVGLETGVKFTPQIMLSNVSLNACET